MGKKREWLINYTGGNESEIDAISESLGISRLTATLLYTRGYHTTEEAERFIRKETVVFHDPFILSDMETAVHRILSALDNKEKIVIYGDYDVDGVTSVSTLYLYLKSHGGIVDYYIPSRTGEGYGINPQAIEALAADGAKLIITVDTGITAAPETEFARSLGLDIIITDHHECHTELPAAVAVINPRRADSVYPFCDLAGVGVVFKLICALEKTLNDKAGVKKNYFRDICIRYGDLIAIGTIADVMPLVDENRLIVSMGLDLIERTGRPGLRALLEVSGIVSDSAQTPAPQKKKITSLLIGYVIAPKINAAGRISNASKAVELFLTESPEEASRIANELLETNKERQTEENHIIEAANRKIEKELDFENDRIIVLDEDNWHHGVIGIVASRITEKYNLPSILISFEGNVGKGSGRSVKGLNLVGALASCSDLLLKFGGHELAAGLSVERDKLPELRRRLNEYARKSLGSETPAVSISVDCEISASDVTLKNASELYLLEPYGVANPVPVFVLRGLNVEEVIPIGTNRHTKLMLSGGAEPITAVCFGKSQEELDIFRGDTVDVVFNLDINNYRGTQTVQLVLRDIDYSADFLREFEKEKSAYSDIKEGKRNITPGEDTIPSRDDFADIYLFIKQNLQRGNDTLSVRAIQKRFGMSYAKVRFALDILYETNILGMERKGDTVGRVERYKFKTNYIRTKINLEKSSILKLLKSRNRE